MYHRIFNIITIKKLDYIVLFMTYIKVTSKTVSVTHLVLLTPKKWKKVGFTFVAQPVVDCKLVFNVINVKRRYIKINFKKKQHFKNKKQ